jgi:hypothetical protein
MKREEKIAYDYFMSMGYDSIEYEPDGNIPPDFLLNGSIAVEVRRLNQYFKNQKNIPLEALDYQLIPRIENLIKSFDLPHITTSAFLTISYARPLKVDKKLIAEIHTILQDHIQSIQEVREYSIRKNLRIRIRPSKRKLPFIYNIGVLSDHDTGGVIVGLLYQNLKLVIAEKAIKVEPYYKRYDEWWLLLTDHIGFSLEDEDINQLISLPINTQYFKKVILVSGFYNTKVAIINKILNNEFKYNH